MHTIRIKKPRLFLVAFAGSIHTARWLNQIIGNDWNIHLLPAFDEEGFHPSLPNIFYHPTFWGGSGGIQTLRMSGFFCGHRFVSGFMRRMMRNLWPRYRMVYFHHLIRKWKPDLIHSLEFQHSGYFVSSAKESFSGTFPPWIATNWGSDIYLFGRLANHQERIKKLLGQCDFYSCECQRDVILGRQFGFSGTVLPVFPNSGGFDLETLAKLRFATPPSQRKLIMLKGNQGFAGRALVGIRALERCGKSLEGYEIGIYSAATDEKALIAPKLLSLNTGVKVTMIPEDTPHEEMLRWHSRARISIGLSISDAISTSFLEALVMGSFPIQSRTACADEWIENNRTGILVHPEDPEGIELAIKKVLADDSLVDTAALINWKTAQDRLNRDSLRKKTREFYERVLHRI
jgi:hypothetical protein